MQDRFQRIEKNYQKFQQILSYIEANIETSPVEELLNRAQMAAVFAWSQSCGLFASPELEALLTRISHRLFPQQPSRLSSPPSAKHRVLMIISAIYGVGGHSRLASRWINIDSDSEYTVVLTMQDHLEIPEQFQTMHEKGLIKLIELKQSTRSQRSVELRELITKTDDVVLLIHPHDVIPSTALASLDNPPPVVFQDHASHTFWLGATVSRLILSETGTMITKRGIVPEHISWTPLPLDTPGDSKETGLAFRTHYGVPPDAVLLMTCGASFKYRAIDDITLSRLLHPLFETHAQLYLVVVGVGLDDMPCSEEWIPLIADFSHRVRFTGKISGQKLNECYLAADIYIDSTPFSSPTTMFEAAVHNLPIVRLALPDWRKTEFSLDMETIPSHLYINTSEKQFQEDVGRLVSDKAYRCWRGKMGKQLASIVHSEEAFKNAIKTAFSKASQMPLIALQPDAGLCCNDRLANLLDQLFDNILGQDKFETDWKILKIAASSVQQGNIEQALKKLTPIAEANSEHWQVYEALAAITRSLGDEHRANLCLQKATEIRQRRESLGLEEKQLVPPTQTPHAEFEVSKATLVQPYSRWKQKRNEQEERRFTSSKLASSPAHNTNVDLYFSYSQETIQPLILSLDSLICQTEQNWRVYIVSDQQQPLSLEPYLQDKRILWLKQEKHEHVSHIINAQVLTSDAKWIGCFEPGIQFMPYFLRSIYQYIKLHPLSQLIYWDEEVIKRETGKAFPLFKPDLNLTFLLSHNYTGPCVISRQTLITVGGYHAYQHSINFDITLRVADALGSTGIGHITDLLSSAQQALPSVSNIEEMAHAVNACLKRNHTPAEIQHGLLENETLRVVYAHATTPKVSIIIPTKNNLNLLGKCVETLLAQTSYPDWELLIVDNGSDDPNTINYYQMLAGALSDRCRVLPYHAPFNFSAMNNLAAKEAKGEYLLLLNNDTECIHQDWLEAMMYHAQRPDVGVVGARLLFPDTLKIQHAGVILGMTGTAGHVFIKDLPHDAAGYMNRAICDQEFSAVTGACLLIRKSIYEEVNGLDEDNFKISFNDIDLCLKVKALGYKIVWTPFATLLHHGSATQLNCSPTPKKITTFQKECDQFFLKWKHQLAHDPAWNPNLSLLYTTPSIEDELVTPWLTGQNETPKILVMPLPSMGASAYRGDDAFSALCHQGAIQYASICRPQIDNERAPSPAELARLAPDTFVLHAPVDNIRGQALLRYGMYNKEVFLVYALDDLITELPPLNPLHHALPATTIKERIALGLKACQRLIVSTQPLADAFKDQIDDIRVIANALNWDIWGQLKSQRSIGSKPRVGWAGAQQHAGDLRFIIEVIKATYTEIDWIFLGMLPEGAAPYVKEFHPFEHNFAKYPEKLASLNLDLAIAPLEIHPFNEAKSNLRLLEYGALGWPVICTDIYPYRTNNPPVTRLPNEAGLWIESIRAKVNRPDLLAQEGDALRLWVEQHYKLEDYLDQWLAAVTR